MLLPEVLDKIRLEFSAAGVVELPLIELFAVDEDVRVSLELKDIDLRSLLVFLAELQDLRIIEDQHGVILLQPNSLVNHFETRLYHIGPEQVARILETEASIQSFLVRMGIVENEALVALVYKADEEKLIIRMPAEGHTLLMQSTISVTPKP